MVEQDVNTPFPEWTEGFEFPPALLKLRATVEGAIIPLYHQGCIAINTRKATTYGTKRTRLRWMILHIQHHESHLLTVLAELVSVRVLTENTDPLDIFLQLPAVWPSARCLVLSFAPACRRSRPAVTGSW